MKRHFESIAGVALVLLSAMCAVAQDSPTLPETKPGQLMAQWVKLCDAADVAGMKKWGEENLNERFLKRVGADSFAKRQGADCAVNGGYQVLSVIDSRPDDLRVLALGRKTNVYVELGMGATPEGKVQGFGSMPTLPPESALPKDLGYKAVASWLNSYADKLAAMDQFSGIAMIARGTQPIATAAAGYADREEDADNGAVAVYAGLDGQNVHGDRGGTTGRSGQDVVRRRSG